MTETIIFGTIQSRRHERIPAWAEGSPCDACRHPKFHSTSAQSSIQRRKETSSMNGDSETPSQRATNPQITETRKTSVTLPHLCDCEHVIAHHHVVPCRRDLPRLAAQVSRQRPELPQIFLIDLRRTGPWDILTGTNQDTHYLKACQCLRCSWIAKFGRSMATPSTSSMLCLSSPSGSR